MTSRDYFEAFCRALENAQEPQSRTQKGSNDRDIFWRVKEILSVCYEGLTDRRLCYAIQRRACDIMLEVSDPREWDASPEVYGAAWRLGNVLPDDDAGSAPVTPFSGTPEQLRSQDLVMRAQDLEHQLDLLNAELVQRQPTFLWKNSRITDLQDRLEAFHRPLSQIRDVAVTGVTVSDFFNVGAAGVRFVDGISKAIFGLLNGAADIELPPQTRELIQRVAARSRDLVRGVAGSAPPDSNLADAAAIFEERIAPHFTAVSVATGNVPTAFRDVNQPWCPEMVAVEPGEFMMGSDDPAHQDERPQHPVTIGYGFAIGRYPVTFEEYDAFCGVTRAPLPDDNGWGRDRRPVINVSWEEAQSYVDWLSAETGQLYRLLTEAEWEYACRAGSKTSYSYGDDDKALAGYGWFVGHLDGSTRPVGERLPNDFGLFDMHGNVWEWVEDVWHENYAATPPGNGGAWLENGNQKTRVLRGGSWVSGAKGLRSAVRFTGTIDYRKNNVGFRVARKL